MTAPPSAPGGGAVFPPGGPRVLTVLLVPLFLSLMSVSIVNVALPAIQSGLGASSADLQWVLSGYTLSFGVVLVAAGRAGDLWGRKPIFVAGILLFTLGSLASGLAGTPLILNLARLLTGLGSGLLNPQIIGIIQNVFQGRARGRAYGLFGTVIGLGVAVGPLLGGVLLSAIGPGWGWRWTFLINVPIGLLAAVLAVRWLRPPRRDPAGATPRTLAALDLGGAGLLAAAVLGIMVPFIVPGTWLLLVPAVLLLWAWWRWERRVKDRSGPGGPGPMVDPDLFRIPSFSFGTVISALFLATMPGVWVIQAVFTQQGLNLSALVAGLASLPSAVLVTVLSPIAGARVHRRGPVFLVWGAALSLVALAAVGVSLDLVARGAWPFWTLAAALGVLGPAQALLMTSAQVLTMHDVPVRAAGTAGGVSQTAQRVLTAIGLAAVTGVFYGVVADAPAGDRGAAGGPDTAAGAATAGVPAVDQLAHQLAYAQAAHVALLVVAGSWLLMFSAAVLDLRRRHRNGSLTLED